MVHGDDKGLRLPPKVAPIQVVIVPIFRSDEDKNKILNYIDSLTKGFDTLNIRYLFDDRTTVSPGFKFNEWEMKGVPIRLEVGSRDIESNNIIYSRRDTNVKNEISINGAHQYLNDVLGNIQNSLFEQAQTFLNDNTHKINVYDDFKSIVKKGGFVECGWDGTDETETAIKKDTKATIRCIPFDQEHKDLKCIYSGAVAKYKVIFSRAY